MPQSALQRFKAAIASTGRPIVGALFPADFEVYILTLELVDSMGNVVDYFSFPIMPDDMTKVSANITNVKKTAGGVISLTTNTFVPQDLTINGNFGRAFKVLVGREVIDFRAFGASIKAMANGGKLENPFDAKIKTGFGCTKILQALVDKSILLDEQNKPYKLFLHNPTLNESYLVEAMVLTLRMDKNTSNRMWAYTLSFKILANSSEVGETGQSSLLNSLSLGALQKGIGILGQGVGELVRTGASNPIGATGNFFKKGLQTLGNSIVEDVAGGG